MATKGQPESQALQTAALGASYNAGLQVTGLGGLVFDHE